MRILSRLCSCFNEWNVTVPMEMAYFVLFVSDELIALT